MPFFVFGFWTFLINPACFLIILLYFIECLLHNSAVMTVGNQIYCKRRWRKIKDVRDISLISKGKTFNRIKIMINQGFFVITLCWCWSLMTATLVQQRFCISHPPPSSSIYTKCTYSSTSVCDGEISSAHVTPVKLCHSFYFYLGKDTWFEVSAVSGPRLDPAAHSKLTANGLWWLDWFGRKCNQFKV